ERSACMTRLRCGAYSLRARRRRRADRWTKVSLAVAVDLQDANVPLHLRKSRVRRFAPASPPTAAQWQYSAPASALLELRCAFYKFDASVLNAILTRPGPDARCRRNPRRTTLRRSCR